MVTFAVNRFIQLSLGIPRRALFNSCPCLGAKRDYNSERPVRHAARARRCSQEDKTLKVAPLVGHAKKESSLFPSGVSLGSREERSLESVARGRGCPVQSLGDGSLYEISSFESEPEFDVIFNDTGEVLKFEDSTGSDMYSMGCEFIEESEQLLDKPQAVSESTVPKRDKTDFHKAKDDAEKMAIESLATRSFTTAELGKKLRGKKYPPDVIKSALDELKGRGLLNDGLYAESFSQSRWISLSWGPRRIKRALLQKGVSEADIDKATNLVFKDGDTSGGPQATYLGMSKMSMDRLFAQASKQWLRGSNASLENRRSRLVRWLQYRGFDWGVTSFILKKLESEHPP